MMNYYISIIVFYMIDPRQSVAILTRIINISISMT